MKIEIEERVLHFKQPAGTSRGVYTERRIWLVKMTDGERFGVGECAPLPNLSCDDIPNYALMLRHFCDDMERTGGWIQRRCATIPPCSSAWRQHGTRSTHNTHLPTLHSYLTLLLPVEKRASLSTDWYGWELSRRCGSVSRKSWHRVSVVSN